MTRLMSCGFETGGILEWFSITQGGISSSLPRHGTYCFGHSTYVNANWRLPSTYSELYFRSGIKNSKGASVYFKEDTVEHIRITCVGATVIAYAKGALVGTYTIPGYIAATWYCIEVYCKIDDDPGLGKIIVRVDNVEVINYTGDTNNAGATGAIDRFQLYASASSAGAFFDDIACDDSEWCGDGYNIAIVPNADVAGSIDLTGSDGNQVDNYALIDEIPVSSSDYVESDVPGESDVYDCTTVTLLSNEVLKYVSVKATGLLDTSGEGYIQTLLNADEGNAIALSDVTQHCSYKGYAVDPADSGAWSQAKLNALQIGAKIT